MVKDILKAFLVCALDTGALNAALTLPLKDYEDAVQVASALASGLDAIVTRDSQGFAGAPLPVLSPADLLAQLPAR